MILVRGKQFSVASYHQEISPQHAQSELAAGLVLEVQLDFQDWLAGERVNAEAFLDPGADYTLISRRWASQQAHLAGAPQLAPSCDPEGRVLEGINISVGGWRAPLGDPERDVWLFDQEYGAEDAGSLPGYEDLLLGRDFISQHGLLVVIDGEGQSFSLLAPIDEENRGKRNAVLSSL